MKAQARAQAELVAPHAGAWIEICIKDRHNSLHIHVAPHAGAWIEIEHEQAINNDLNRRSPRGSVD